MQSLNSQDFKQSLYPFQPIFISLFFPALGHYRSYTAYCDKTYGNETPFIFILNKRLQRNKGYWYALIFILLVFIVVNILRICLIYGIYFPIFTAIKGLESLKSLIHVKNRVAGFWLFRNGYSAIVRNQYL